MSVMAKWLDGPLLGREVGSAQATLSWMGTELPLPRKRGTAPPQFSADVYCGQTAGCIQYTTWYEGRPRPRRHCVRWTFSCPWKATVLPNFRPMSVVAKQSLASQLLLSSCIGMCEKILSLSRWLDCLQRVGHWWTLQCCQQQMTSLLSRNYKYRYLPKILLSRNKKVDAENPLE